MGDNPLKSEITCTLSRTKGAAPFAHGSNGWCDGTGCLSVTTPLDGVFNGPKAKGAAKELKLAKDDLLESEVFEVLESVSTSGSQVTMRLKDAELENIKLGG